MDAPSNDRAPPAECIFTDWSGRGSPLKSTLLSVTHIRNSVFRRMHLGVELVDVSEGGIVRFSGVSLANVTLVHGAVVSTTTNDYSFHDDVFYLASDDEEYDVVLVPVPPSAKGTFGEDFVIENETMSDCLYMLAKEGQAYPGCPEESVAGRHRLLRSGDRESFDYLDFIEDAADGDLLLSELLIEPGDDWLKGLQNVRSLCGVGPVVPVLERPSLGNEQASRRSRHWQASCMCTHAQAPLSHRICHIKPVFARTEQLPCCTVLCMATKCHTMCMVAAAKAPARM